MRAIFIFAVIAVSAAAAWNANCINKPVGFASGTTGGQGGTTVYPKNEAELEKYLCSNIDVAAKACRDNTKRIIVLSKTFSFSSGSITQKARVYNNCGNGQQMCITTFAGACNGASSLYSTVKVNSAGMSPLIVGSNKSILGQGGKGGLIGRGLAINRATNVIVQDISITDINPQAVWAGDALTISDSSKVWIHKVRFQNVGRQMIVANGNSNTGITISSCFFQGKTVYSAYCDGTHYWLWLFRAKHNEITLINNYIANTSGRGPHAGGMSNTQNYIHMVSNYFDYNTQHAIEPKLGSYVLAEGNSFNKVRQVWSNNDAKGNLYLVSNNNDAAKCKGYLGYNCAVNGYSGSSTSTRLDLETLNAFSKLNKNALSSARWSRC